jgi:hypothetical protein
MSGHKKRALTQRLETVRGNLETQIEALRIPVMLIPPVDKMGGQRATAEQEEYCSRNLVPAFEYLLQEMRELEDVIDGLNRYIQKTKKNPLKSKQADAAKQIIADARAFRAYLVTLLDAVCGLKKQSVLNHDTLRRLYEDIIEE